MHFDLGVAYHELGLPLDAIGEWLLSAEHRSYACTSLIFIARARLALGDRAGAREALYSSVTGTFPSREQWAGINALERLLDSEVPEPPAPCASRNTRAPAIAYACPSVTLMSVDPALSDDVDSAFGEAFGLA
jgi:hypothetical protein